MFEILLSFLQMFSGGGTLRDENKHLLRKKKTNYLTLTLNITIDKM